MPFTAEAVDLPPRCLLDTHIWLWADTEPSRLPKPIMRMLTNPSCEVLLSAASVWEIAIKFRLGRLHLPQAPEVFIPDRMRRTGTSALPIRQEHAIAAGALPDHHKDPFDRMLVAQAALLKAPLVTADRRLQAYDVHIIDA